MSELAFYRVLRRGSNGRDVLAVKRALARAGHGHLGSLTPLFGPFTVTNLRRFQDANKLTVTGVYDKRTHRKLIQHFDARARALYERASQTPAVPVGKPVESPGPALQLPQTFRATHQTAGLPGYPAVDVFAAPSTVVLAPEDGFVDRLSGHDPAHGGHPGGAYGWTIYLTAPSGRYFLTHLGSRFVTTGDKVRRGQPIGTVCDSAISGKPGTSHVHEGKRTSP